MTEIEYSGVVASFGAWIQRHAAATVFLLGLALLIPGTWSESGITEVHEYARTLRTPLEMIERDSWLTPWLNGEPRFRKPPLVYWAIAVTYKLFGVHLLCGRLWGALLGSGMAVCVVLLARELFRSDGLLAGLMTLATVGVTMAGREAMLDLPVAALSVFGVYCFLRWQRDFAIGWLLASASVVAAAALTKGPVALVFYGGAVLTWPLVCDGLVGMRKHWLHWLGALAVFLALALPWPVWMYLEWGERYTSSLLDEAAERKFFDFSEASPGAAVGGALGLALPWTLIVLFAFWDGLRGKDIRATRERRWLVVWGLAALVPFLFMKTYERYMIGLVPTLILLAAEWLEREPSGGRERLLRWSFGLAATILLVLAGLVWWLVPGWDTLGFALILAILVALTRRHFRPCAVAFGFALALTVFWAGSYPRLGVAGMPAELAPEVRRYPVALHGTEPKLLSVRLGYSLQQFSCEEWKKGGPGPHDRLVVIVKEDELDEFRAVMARHGLTSRFLRQDRICTNLRHGWRRDVSASQLFDALARRSLEEIKPYYHSYLVTQPPGAPDSPSAP